MSSPVESNQSYTLLGVTKNSDNYGVRVLLSAAVESLVRAFPGARIAVLDYGPKREEWAETLPAGAQQIPLINLRFSWKIFLSNNIFRLVAWVAFSRILPLDIREHWWSGNDRLRRIAGARAHFSIAGGDSFSDIYGLRRFAYVVLPQILVLLMQRPLVQLPQTYGPFRTGFARTVTRWILRRSHTVFSRDEAGVLTVRQLMGTHAPTVQVVPDIGLAMSPQPLPGPLQTEVATLRTRGPVIGLNISSLLYMGGYSGTNMFGLREDFPRLIDDLVAGLVSEPGVQVLLVPHVCGGPLSQEDETRLCEKLLPTFQSRFGKQPVYFNHSLNHRQTKTLIGQCDIFIGARMHACVAAVSQGVPAVCLAYSGKFSGVMAPLGPAARVVDLRTADAGEILQAALDVFRNRANLRRELQDRLKLLPDFSRSLAFCMATIPDARP